MRNPLEDGLMELDETPSTQTIALEAVRRGDREIGVFFTHHQSSGRGRFDRVWESVRDEALTVSFALWEWQDHPAPYLAGMTAAIAAARAFDSRVAWPNDLLVGAKKVGGILTEVATQPGSTVPVLGLGLNLSQQSFPKEITETATSLLLERGIVHTPEDALTLFCREWAAIPMPHSFRDIREIWLELDATPMKRYRTLEGRPLIGLGVDDDGQLIASCDGLTLTLPAAEALFGNP